MERVLIGDDVGRVAAIIGFTAIGAILALILLYTVAPPFGPINDMLNAGIAVLSVVLAVVILRAHGGSPAPLILVAAGAGVAALGSWLVMSGTTGYWYAGFVSSIGFGLVGAWLILTVASPGFGGALPPGLARLGMVAGAVMLLGFIGAGGVLLGVDTFADTPWWLWLAGIGWLSVYVLYPVWCLLVWRAA